MATTRSSIPPAPKRERAPGPAKAKSKRKTGNVFSQRNPLLEGSFHDVGPKEKSVVWRMSDSNPPVSEKDFEGACNCWGDNNPFLTKEELEAATSAQTEP
jgi:hypothetical protein